MMNNTQNTTIVPTTPVQTSLSVNEFEKKKKNFHLKKRNLKLQLKILARKLEEQKPHAIKWSELQENQIYTITNMLRTYKLGMEMHVQLHFFSDKKIQTR